MAFFRVETESQNYRHVECDVSWQFDTQFLHLKPVENWISPALKFKSLADDIAYEQELIEYGENGDTEFARRRFANGPADLMWSFNGPLLLSARACDVLRHFIAQSGQLLPVQIEDEAAFFYHCTTLFNATSESESQVNYLSTGHPSGAPDLVLNPAFVKTDGFFRTNWPKPPSGIPPIDYAEFPPPDYLYVTQAVADAIESSELTGFKLVNARVSNSG